MDTNDFDDTTDHDRTRDGDPGTDARHIDPKDFQDGSGITDGRVSEDQDVAEQRTGHDQGDGDPYDKQGVSSDADPTEALIERSEERIDRIQQEQRDQNR